MLPLHFCVFFYGFCYCYSCFLWWDTHRKVFIMSDHHSLAFLLTSYACMPGKKDGLKNKATYSILQLKGKLPSFSKIFVENYIPFYFPYWPFFCTLYFQPFFNYSLAQCLNSLLSKRPVSLLNCTLGTRILLILVLCVEKYLRAVCSDLGCPQLDEGWDLGRK